MYKYTFADKYQRTCKYYPSTTHVDGKSFDEIVKQGFPSDLIYRSVLSKCMNFTFYSKKRVKVIYVNGYPVDVKFFTETEIGI